MCWCYYALQDPSLSQSRSITLRDRNQPNLDWSSRSNITLGDVSLAIVNNEIVLVGFRDSSGCTVESEAAPVTAVTI